MPFPTECEEAMNRLSHNASIARSNIFLLFHVSICSTMCHDESSGILRFNLFFDLDFFSFFAPSSSVDVSLLLLFFLLSFFAFFSLDDFFLFTGCVSCPSPFSNSFAVSAPSTVVSRVDPTASA